MARYPIRRGRGANRYTVRVGKPVRRFKPRRYRKPRLGLIKRVVNRELQKHTETKQLVCTAGSSDMTHNTMYIYHPLGLLNVGTSVSTRVGDQVYFRNIRIRGTLRNISNHPFTQMRILGIWTDVRLAAHTGIGYASGMESLFHPSASSLANAMINNKRTANVQFDRLITVDRAVGATWQDKVFNINVPIYRKKTYESSSIYLKDKQFYLIFIPSVPAGITDGTAVFSRLNLDVLVTYQDA